MNIASFLLAASLIEAAPECSVSNECIRRLDSPLLEDVAASENVDSQVHLVQINSKVYISSEKQKPKTTTVATTTSMTVPTDGAQASGVTVNADEDWEAFLAGLLTNLAMIVVCILIFMWGLRYFPIVYKNNVLTGIQSYEIPEGSFGWAKAGLGISVDKISDTVGLDQGMLIEMTEMYMKILLMFGLPMLLIMGPMNCFFGGYAAGKDYLSYLSFGNVELGSWLYWVHCFNVWGVVLVVQTQIYAGMDRFIERRIEWLMTLPSPRCNTIMVEGIPLEYRSDKKLREFFSKLFGQTKIKGAVMVKRAKKLKHEFNRKRHAVDQHEALKGKWEEQGADPEKRPKSWRGVDLLEFYEKEIVEADQGIKDERAEAKKGAEEVGNINGYNGFVQFYEPADAEIALSVQYATDKYEWVVSTPPPPMSLRWSDLEQSPHGKVAWTIFGYMLTGGLYMLYLPIVIWMTTIAIKIKFPGAMQPFWEALAPTVGLQFMVCFLPTFLRLIFSMCFTLQDEAYSQKVLQNWYFFFQFVFVILVTAVGDSLWLFMKTLVVSPLEIMPMLASTMPHATHFYMNFLVLSWATHSMNFTRYIPLGKFLFFRKVFSEEKAKQMAEPEDQDYYGLGSRNARFTIMMSIGIIFGTLCPPIPILAYVNFFFCRLFYGYLICFAEEKKQDLGGIFFVDACRQIFVANIFYVLLMTGVLYARASSGGPATIAVGAVAYMLWSMERFETEFQYEKMPFQHHLKDLTKKMPREIEGSYIQPEWAE